MTQLRSLISEVPEPRAFRLAAKLALGGRPETGQPAFETACNWGPPGPCWNHLGTNPEAGRFLGTGGPQLRPAERPGGPYLVVLPDSAVKPGRHGVAKLHAQGLRRGRRPLLHRPSAARQGRPAPRLEKGAAPKGVSATLRSFCFAVSTNARKVKAGLKSDQSRTESGRKSGEKDPGRCPQSGAARFRTM